MKEIDHFMMKRQKENKQLAKHIASWVDTAMSINEQKTKANNNIDDDEDDIYIKDDIDDDNDNDTNNANNANNTNNNSNNSNNSISNNEASSDDNEKCIIS